MEYEYGEYALDENVEMDEEELLAYGYGEAMMVNQNQGVQVQLPAVNQVQQQQRAAQQQSVTQQQRVVQQQQQQRVVQQQPQQPQRVHPQQPQQPQRVVQQQQHYQQQQLHQQQQQKQKELQAYYENKAAADEKRILKLEAQYAEAKKRFNDARQEIATLKNRKSDDGGNARDKIKALEERVALIKTKAKEKIDEKEGMITELNGKIKNYEEMLAMLEVNCKEAVVKFNDFQEQLAQKEEIIQKHAIFKNRYDYTVNFLTEKCQFITDQYEKRIRDLENKLNNSQHQESGTEKPQYVKNEFKSAQNQKSESEVTSENLLESEELPLAPKTDCVSEISEMTDRKEDLNVISSDPENPDLTSSPDKNKITLDEAIDELETVDKENVNMDMEQ